MTRNGCYWWFFYDFWIQIIPSDTLIGYNLHTTCAVWHVHVLRTKWLRGFNVFLLCFYRFLLLFVLFKTEQVSSQRGFTLVRLPNMIQTTGKIKNLKVNSISECLQRCLADCRCSAFDLRESDMTCYLRSYPKNTPQLKQLEGHGHFDIKQVLLTMIPVEINAISSHFFSQNSTEISD